MHLFSHFIPLASFLLFTLAAYGTIGILFNVRAISPPNTFRGKWPLNEKPALVVLMINQIGLVVTSGFAIIGVIRKSHLIFYCPAFILLGIFAALSIFGGVCLRESQRDISHQIFKAIQENANKTREYFTWLSDVQWESECCGVNSYLDWELFQFPELSLHSVPHTCCIRNVRIPARNCGEGVSYPSQTKTEIESILFTKGCGPKISSQHSHILLWIAIEMLIVGMISLLVAAFLYLGVTKIMSRTPTKEAPESSGDGSQDRNAHSDNANNNAPPFSSNRRQQNRESTIAFTDDLGANRAVDRRVQRFRVTRNNNTKAILRSGPGTKMRATRATRQTARKIAHQQHHSRQVYNPAMLEAEMLFQPRDNHSILSTTPFPSDVHSFVNYFHKSKAKDQKTESGDSDVNLANSDKTRRTGSPSGLRAVSHYSSLPQVYLVTPPSTNASSDTRSKVMAELKQRIPPTFKNPAVYKLKSESQAQSDSGQPLSPFPAIPTSGPSTNQTLHTQHHHYYRIPSPSASYAAPHPHPAFSIPEPIPIPIPTTCSTIAEEPENENVKSVTFKETVEEIVEAPVDHESYSSQDTLSFLTEHISSEGFHPTIFEVFGTQSEPSVLETEEEFLGNMSIDIGLSEPTQFMTSLQIPIPTGILDVTTSDSDNLVQQENIETNESKADPETIDLESILCFNVTG